MKMFLLMLCLVLFAVGCQNTVAPGPIPEGDITYFEDSRTGLCFAALSSITYGGHDNISISNVPCSAVAQFVRHTR